MDRKLLNTELTARLPNCISDNALREIAILPRCLCILADNSFLHVAPETGLTLDTSAAAAVKTKGPVQL